MLKRFGTFSTAGGCCSRLCSAATFVAQGLCLLAVVFRKLGSIRVRMLEFFVDFAMGIPKLPLLYHCLLRR